MKKLKCKQQILKYVEEHCGECDLTLALVAQKFGVSETYLYYYFKNKIDETFSACLERFRMDKAKNALKYTNYSIEKISEMVGYTSLRSFQRAFKRVLGSTPKEFRTNNCSG